MANFPRDDMPASVGLVKQLIQQMISTRPFDEGVKVSAADGITAYYNSLGTVVSASAAVPGVGDLQFTPYWPGAGGALDQLLFNVITGGTAGSVARCGLYTADATMYWFAFICGVAAPTCSQVTSGLHLFGRNVNFNAQFGRIKTGFGYGPLPASAPSGLAMMTSNCVMVLEHWAFYQRTGLWG